MKVWSPDDEGADFELTPMIDVVFLLIAFFMTLASFITAELIEIEIPIAEAATVPEEKSDRQYLTVTTEGSLYFGAIEVNEQQLADYLANAIQTNPHLRIYLRADANATHENVNKVMQACASVGIFNLIFATNQS